MIIKKNYIGKKNNFFLLLFLLISIKRFLPMHNSENIKIEFIMRNPKDNNLEKEITKFFYNYTLVEYERIEKILFDFNNSKILAEKKSKGVTAKGLSFLVNIFEKTINIKDLILDLSSNCSIQEEGAKCLGGAFLNFKNLSFLNLNLSSNYIKDNGLEYISNGLQKLGNFTFLALALSYNMISDKGVEYLSLKLASKRIIDLNINLSNNYIHRSNFLGYIKEIKDLENFRLDLSFNKIIDIDSNNQDCLFKDLVNFYFDLKCNYIKKEAIQKIFNSISNIVSFSIDLTCNHLNNEDIKFVIDDFKNFNNLVFLNLNLRSNKIESIAIEDLIVGFKEIKKLRKLILDLSGNPEIKEDYWKNLLKEIKIDNLNSLTLILDLELDWSFIKEFLSKNEELVFLSLFKIDFFKKKINYFNFNVEDQFLSMVMQEDLYDLNLQRYELHSYLF